MLEVRGYLISIRRLDNAQDVDEQVDDVQVQVEGGKDVLLGRDGHLVSAAHHELRVVDEVQAEEHGTEGRVDEADDAVARDEHGDDAEEEQDEEADEEPGAPGGEVVLGLEREEREAHADEGGYPDGHEDFVLVEVGRDGPEHEP